MSERYSRLFSLPENLYAAGSPVVIAAGALLKDNQTAKIIVQLKLLNIVSKTIKAVKVSILPFDVAGNPLKEEIDHQYLDLSASRDDTFGAKTPIVLSDASVRSFQVKVTEVIFADNTIWKGIVDLWEPMDSPIPLSSLNGFELEKQFQLKYGHNCKNMLTEHKDLWYCVCGSLNKQEEANCHKCRKTLEMLKAFNLDALNEEKNVRVKAEKEKAEEDAKKAAAHAKKARKLGLLAAAISILVITAFLLFTKVIVPNKQYQEALSLVKSGQYDAAIEVFIALGDYKDSPEQVKLAANAKTALENSKTYAQAQALMESGEYEQALDIFLSLDNYENSATLSETCEKEIAYANALAILDSGNDQQAFNALCDLGDFKDTQTILSDFVPRMKSRTGTWYDGSGSTLEYFYDNQNRLEHIENDGQKETAFFYHDNGNLRQVETQLSNQIWRIHAYVEDGYTSFMGAYDSKKGDYVEAWELEYGYNENNVVHQIHIIHSQANKDPDFEWMLELFPGDIIEDADLLLGAADQGGGRHTDDSSILSILRAGGERREVYSFNYYMGGNTKITRIVYDLDQNGNPVQATKSLLTKQGEEIGAETYFTNSYDQNQRLLESRYDDTASNYNNSLIWGNFHGNNTIIYNYDEENLILDFDWTINGNTFRTESFGYEMVYMPNN